MKRTVIIAFAGIILSMLTFLMAEGATKKGDGFFKINDNIQNEDLPLVPKINEPSFF